MLVGPPKSDLTGSPETDATRNMETQGALLQGGAVTAAVRAKVGVAPSVLVAPVGSTDVLEVRARASRQKPAADVVNAYMAAYVEVRHTQLKKAYDKAIEEFNNSSRDIVERINALGGEFASVSPNTRPILEQNLRDTLEQEMALNQQRSDQYARRAEEEGGPPEVLTPATSPTAPATSRTSLAAPALLLGIVLGIALALLLEYLQRPEALSAEGTAEEVRGERAGRTADHDGTVRLEV